MIFLKALIAADRHHSVMIQPVSRLFPALLAFDSDLIRKYDGFGPRYTSYPTADRFVEAFDAAAYESWLARRNVGWPARPLVTVHPHAILQHDLLLLRCNKIVTRGQVERREYLKYLNERSRCRSTLGEDSASRSMHWGGGTPNFFCVEEMAQLMQRCAVISTSPRRASIRSRSTRAA